MVNFAVNLNIPVTLFKRSFVKMTNVTIEDRIKEQGDLVRKLKSQKAEKEKINEEVAKLKALKEELSQANKPPANPEVEAKIKAEEAEKSGKAGFSFRKSKVQCFTIRGKYQNNV